ncbi:MAG: PAS domain-containing sensor histidine kinase [Promethearchaeota archaeon]|jgi:PAS domain S-box-containing protein
MLDKEFYHVITENAYDLISVLSIDFIHEYINENTYFKKLGYCKEELIGTSALQFIHPDDISKSIESKSRSIQQGYSSSTIRLKHKDGHWLWFETTTGTYKDINGDLKGIIIARDINDKKIAEEKLKQSEQNYREAYEQMNLYQDVLTHDINNVIAAISSSLQVYSILKNTSEIDTDVKDLISNVEISISKAKNLIENVRKLKKLEENEQPLLKKLDILEILNDVIQYIRTRFKKQKITIKVESDIEELYINGTPLLIDVFENILNNAVKYNTNVEVEISINIKMILKENSKYIQIEFNDNGIGIPDENKKIIFQEGYMDKKGGKGLGYGLTVVKKIIHQFNGKIWVEDRIKRDYTQGTKFVILLPEFK